VKDPTGLKPTDCDCWVGGGKYSSSNTKLIEGVTKVFPMKSGCLLVLWSFPTFLRRDRDEYFKVVALNKILFFLPLRGEAGSERK